MTKEAICCMLMVVVQILECSLPGCAEKSALKKSGRTFLGRLAHMGNFMRFFLMLTLAAFLSLPGLSSASALGGSDAAASDPGELSSAPDFSGSGAPGTLYQATRQTEWEEFERILTENSFSDALDAGKGASLNNNAERENNSPDKNNAAPSGAESSAAPAPPAVLPAEDASGEKSGSGAALSAESSAAALAAAPAGSGILAESQAGRSNPEDSPASEQAAPANAGGSAAETEGSSGYAAAFVGKPAPADDSGAFNQTVPEADASGGRISDRTLSGLEDGDPAQLSEAAAGRQEAYQRSLEALLPVSPEEIKVFRQKLDQRDEALSDSPPKTLRTRTERLSLSPGFKPPEVELTPNLVTALVFLDSSGSAWPVTSSVLGSGNLYRSEVLKNDSDNRIIVSPLSSHGNSNLIVTLQNHEIPLVIRLVTRSGFSPDRSADGLIIFQVQGRGPKAAPELNKNASSAPVDAVLYSILDGIAPSGSKVLSGEPLPSDTEFLKLNDKLYVRTRHSLLWPGWKARAAGPGGWTVFEAPLQSPVLIAAGDEIIRVSLQGGPGM